MYLRSVPDHLLLLFFHNVVSVFFIVLDGSHVIPVCGRKVVCLPMGTDVIEMAFTSNRKIM